MPSISLIIPVYNEAENIRSLYKEICEVMHERSYSFELLFIDDHSTDHTASVIADIVKTDSNVRGFRLLRNTKKSGALQLGFHEAKGDVLITLDGDMQDDPHEIPAMLQAIDNGADVVIGWRKQREDAAGKLIPSAVINRLTNWVLGQRLRDMNSGFKAFRRETIACMSFQGSLFRFLPHLLKIEGFDVREIPIHHRRRQCGESKFSLRHRLRSLFDLGTVYFLSKYGDRPMHFFGAIGLCIFAAGLVCSGYLFTLWMQNMGVGSRPLLMLAILLLIIGVQVVSIGFIGGTSPIFASTQQFCCSQQDVIGFLAVPMVPSPQQTKAASGQVPLSIVMPIFNEEKTLREILRRVFQVCADAECIFVDDGSCDNSLQILRELARPQDTVLTKENGGKGSAVRMGYAHATGRYTIVQDADLEYSPEEIPALLGFAQANDAKAVFGSRRLKRQKQYVHFSFFIGGTLLTYLCNFLYRTRLTDQPTCYKMVRTDILRVIPLRENDFRFDPELTCHLALRKVPILEYPVSYHPRSRAEGKKICWKDWFRWVWVFLRMRIIRR